MTLTHREVLWFVFCMSLFFLCTLSVMTTLIHFPDVLALPQSCFQGFPDAWCVFRTSVKPLAVWMHLQVMFPFFNLNTISFDLWNLFFFSSEELMVGDVSWVFHKTDVKVSQAELSYGGDQGANLVLASTTQQSCGWGLSLLVLRIALLPLFCSPAWCKIKSNDAPFPHCVSLLSWLCFLERATGTG